MKAFVIEKVSDLNDNPQPLKLIEVENPVAGIDEIVIEVRACGVCHTEIDEIEGRATPSFIQLFRGIKIVGEVVDVGKGATKFNIGDRAGAGWIYSACGNCEFCKEGLKIYVRILRQQEKTLMVDMRNISRLIQNSLSKYLRILLLKRLLHFSALVQLDTDL